MFDRHTKLKSIPMTTLKSSQLRFPAPKWSLVYHPHHEVYGYVKTAKPVIFDRCDFACYTYGYMILWCNNNMYSKNTSTNSCCSRRVHTAVKTPKILHKYACHILYFTTWNVLGCGPSPLYIVFVGVMYSVGRKSQQYTSVLPTANTAIGWGRIALLILIVYHRGKTTVFIFPWSTNPVIQ